MEHYNKTVKYPFDQYKRLVEILQVIKNKTDINLESYHPAEVWYLAYTQVSTSNAHNRLGFDQDGNVCKQYQAKFSFTPLMESDNSLKIDIEGIKDSHRDTATKRALKELSNS